MSKHVRGSVDVHQAVVRCIFSLSWLLVDGSTAKEAVLSHLGPNAADVRIAIRSFIKLSTAIKSKTDTRLVEIVCCCVDGIFEELFRHPSSDHDKRK